MDTAGSHNSKIQNSETICIGIWGESSAAAWSVSVICKSLNAKYSFLRKQVIPTKVGTVAITLKSLNTR